MKFLFKLSLFTPLLLPLFLVVIFAAALAGNPSSNISNGTTFGRQTTLTAKEVAQKASISEERAEDVIKILNFQLSKEGFTLAGSSGSL
ncbi:TPA: CHAP domain-containing protein, partial [Streptococcus suis]